MADRMKEAERGLCRPGGLKTTDQLFWLAGITGHETALRVLDVGCGEGATIEYLRGRYPAWSVSGIDPRPELYTEGMIETGTAEQLPFSDDSMDLLLMECSCSGIPGDAGPPGQLCADLEDASGCRFLCTGDGGSFGGAGGLDWAADYGWQEGPTLRNAWCRSEKS